jgi:hypothetical protein
LGCYLFLGGDLGNSDNEGRTVTGDVISVLGRASKEDIRTEPFPHLVLRDALPQDIFEELTTGFPTNEAIAGSRAMASNKLIMVNARQVAERFALSDIWKTYFDYHTSHAFFLDVIELWQDFIEEAYPNMAAVLGKPLSDATTNARRSGEAENPENRNEDIQLDCQFGINCPVDTPSSVRGPHIDSANKLFAGLLYCRHPDDDSTGGALEMYRYRDPQLHYRPGQAVDRELFIGRSARKLSRVPSEDVEKITDIPYQANVLVMWLNTPYVLHGVSNRQPTPWSRRYTNLLGEFYGGDGKGFFQMNRKKPLWPFRFGRK